MGKRRLISMLVAISLVLFDGLIYGEKQDSLSPGLFTIQSDDYGVVLELITPSFKTKERIVDGSTYQLMELPYKHGQTDEAGKPQVPVKGVLLGIPYDASIKVKVLDYDEVILSGYNLYPTPEAYLEKKLPPRLKGQEYKKQLKRLDERTPDRFKYRFIKDDTTYSQDKFYPDVLAEVSSAGSLRGQEIAKLKLYPIQFNPVTGKIRFCKRIKVEVDFGKKAEIDGKSTEDTPATFKKLYKDILQNYEDVKYWKKGKKAKSGLAYPAAPVEPAAVPSPILIPYPAYKVSINEDGIYRLTWQDLYDAEIDLFSLDPRNIKIFNQGKQVHIYVKGEDDGSFDSQDYIEFYAKATDTRYTSTNIYWLTFTGEPGVRMLVKDIPGDNSQIPDCFKSNYHLERNEMYWMELPDRGYVDDHWFFRINDAYGTGGMWAFPGVPCSEDFTLPLTDVAVVGNLAKIKVALLGISSYYGLPELDHHSIIYLNGNRINDATWATDVECKLEIDIPQSYLMEGDNAITVELPGDTGAD
jgi:Propeptide_C25